MGVLMQAFYWDCPLLEERQNTWWTLVASKLPDLRRAGFTALWLPPASKAASVGGKSMGYDVYDHWDLGSHFQKGSTETWFGSESDLRSLIRGAHGLGMQVYADLVLNHCSGGDGEELNPINGTTRWTRFTPASGRFTRDWTCFNPSPYPDPDPGTYGDMPDLCHINPRVSTNILNLAKWLVEDVGFDGFRYDFVRGFVPWMIRAIHERAYRRNGARVEIFGVGECWDGDALITEWLDSVNRWAVHTVAAFDFPLRGRLKGLCDEFGFSLRRLVEGGVLAIDRPREAVTFVDNHDFRGADGGSEIVNDKILAYAYILTHEGYPCVFWKDYYRYALAKPGRQDGIDALVAVHEAYAGGATENLWVDDDFYAMERTGAGSQPGLVFALGNAGDVQTRTVRTRFAGRELTPAAWCDRTGAFVPEPVTPDADGVCQLRVGPRGYVVLAPRR